MLHRYTCNHIEYIECDTRNEIARISQLKLATFGHKWTRRPSHAYPVSPRTYRTTERDQQPTLFARIVYAIKSTFPAHDITYSHHTVRALARLVMRSARFCRVDTDNPETHIAFSPNGISARDKKRRRSLTFGRFIRRKCDNVFRAQWAMTDKQVDQMAIAFQTEAKLPPLQIVTGEAAFNIYHGCSITSCMTHDDTTRHHFEANEDKVFLVIGRMGGELALRAKLYLQTDGTYFLDRIYCADIVYQAFGDSVKVSDLLASQLERDGYTMSHSYDFRLTQESGESFPYMDKARDFDRINNSTVRFHPCGKYSADNTDGEDSSDQCEKCSCCGDRIDDGEGSHVHDDAYCDSCYSDRFTYDEVSDCDIDSDDAVETINNVTTHRDNCSRLSTSFYNHGEWELSDDTCEAYDGETIACEHVRMLHDGEVSHKDDSSIVELSCGDYAQEDDCTEVDGDWYLTEDCVELANGEWAHVDDCECFHIVDDYGTAVIVWMLVDVAELILA